jgi:hypothetical protein
VYGISQEMVQPGSGGFNQVDREELDDEQIIVCPSCNTREAIILQPNIGVNFAVVFGDVAWCLEMSRKTSVVHGAPECFGIRPFRAEVASFAIIVAPLMWVLHVWLELRNVIPWAMPLEVLTGHSAIPSSRRPGNLLVRRPFQRLEPLGWPVVPRP